MSDTIVRLCRCHRAPCVEAGEDTVCCSVTGKALDYWTGGKGQVPEGPRKWCRVCLRYLLRSAFYLNGGWPAYDCKACHSDLMSEAKRRRYRSDPEFREKDKAKSAAYYAKNRAKRIEQMRAKRLARKLGAAA